MNTIHHSKGNTKVAIVSILAVVLLAGGGFYLLSQKDQPTPSAQTQKDDSPGFSFEYQDDDGERVKIQSGDSE